MIKTQDMLIIDCLEYVNWDRKLFEHAKSSGLNIIHVTIASVSYTHLTLPTNREV
mgnify:CR=1 FL=1